MSRLSASLAVVLTTSLLPVAAGAPSAVAAPAATPDLRAVIVGVDHFLGKTRPNIGAVRDATNAREALVRNG
ncbi:MAG TPA: hypothetical protein VII47_15170, partial [Actinomycetota bacterium]